MRRRAGACGSPVSSRDSAPVTYSAPQSGSRSPVSVASITQSAAIVVAAVANVTARHAVAVDVGRDRRVPQQHVSRRRSMRREHRLEHRDRRPAARALSGSRARAPGFRSGRARAASVSGKCAR